MCLSFDLRFPRLKVEIAQSAADIVILQECDNFEQYYLPMFTELGYFVCGVEKKIRFERLVIAFRP